MYSKLSLISAALLLSACQTVQDQSIPLSKEFSQSAEQFQVKRPTWRLSDTAYQQKLHGKHLTYDISGAKTGWGKSEQSQLWFSESGGLIENLEISDKFLRFLFLDLLDMRKKSSRRYVLNTENDFAFTVNANQNDAVQVRCRLLSMNDQLETTYQMGDNKTRRRDKSTRLNSYLGCDLQSSSTSGSKNWSLTVDTLHHDTPRISMVAHGQKNEASLEFKTVKDSSYLLNGEWRSLPNNFQHFTGLQIQMGSQSLGALSFEGQTPKIWIADQIPSEHKTVMLAMSYSLMMYDWLDSAWRSRH